MRQRGFSLLEILLAALLLSLLIGLAMVAAPGTAERGGSMAAAEALAGALRKAQQRAISEQVPVAVGLPSEGGTRPHAQSFYMLAGESQARLIEVGNLASENPGAYLAAGSYNLVPGHSWSRAPLAAARAFDLTAWSPFAGDPVILFTPSGQAVSNLPQVDGEYRLLACAGLTWTAATVVGEASFQLDNLHHPVTVGVSQTGQVRVVPGLPEAAGVALAVGPGVPATAPATPPALPAGVNQDPVVLGPATVAPEPLAANLPAGVDATVALDRHLSLRVEATDADGDILYCHWSVAESPGGAFASSHSTRMDWDPESNAGAGAWVSTWQWTPPPGVGVGSRFHLSCQISDLRGGASTGLVGSTGVIEVLEREQILASGTSRGAFLYDLHLMNTDGTGVRRVVQSQGDYDRFGELSPDGTKIAFVRGSTELRLMNRDGSHQTVIATGIIRDVRWHPLGTCLAYLDGDVNTNTNTELCLVLADGSHPRTRAPNSSLTLLNLTGQIGLGAQFDWHPLGDRLVVNDAAQTQLREIGIDATTWTIPWQATLHVGSELHSPAYSPDGQWLAYSSWSGLHVGPYTYSAGGAGAVGPFTSLAGLPGPPAAPGAKVRWAPDSVHLLTIYDLNGGAWSADYATASVSRTGADFQILTPDVGPGLEWVDPQWVRR